MIRRCLIVVLALLVYAHGLGLPSYIKACHKNAPDIDACCLKSAQAAFPVIAKGDKNYGVPPLNPLKLPLIEIATPNLKLKFKDVTVKGLDAIQIVKMHIDFDNKKVQTVAKCDLETDANYEMDGKIMVLPITGEGKANIKFDAVIYTYTSDYNLIDTNGDQYMKFYSASIEYKMDKAEFNFQNLFNGNQKLAGEMNKFLNDNWEDVMKDLGSGFTDTVKDVAELVYKKYLEAIPFSQLYPE